MGTGGQYRIRPALWDPVPPEPACWHRAIYQTAPGWGVLGGTLVGMSLLTVSRQAVQKGLPAAFCSPLVRSGVGRGANKNQSQQPLSRTTWAGPSRPHAQPSPDVGPRGPGSLCSFILHCLSCSLALPQAPCCLSEVPHFLCLIAMITLIITVPKTCISHPAVDT